jgi:hypothetical protein
MGVTKVEKYGQDLVDVIKECNVTWARPRIQYITQRNTGNDVPSVSSMGFGARATYQTMLRTHPIVQVIALPVPPSSLSDPMPRYALPPLNEKLDSNQFFPFFRGDVAIHPSPAFFCPSAYTPEEKEDHMHVTEEDHMHVTEEDHMHVTEEDHMHVTEEDHMHVTQEDHMHVTEEDHMHVTEEDHMHVTEEDHMHVTDCHEP